MIACKFVPLPEINNEINFLHPWKISFSWFVIDVGYSTLSNSSQFANAADLIVFNVFGSESVFNELEINSFSLIVSNPDSNKIDCNVLFSILTLPCF